MRERTHWPFGNIFLGVPAPASASLAPELSAGCCRKGPGTRRADLGLWSGDSRSLSFGAKEDEAVQAFDANIRAVDGTVSAPRASSSAVPELGVPAGVQGVPGGCWPASPTGAPGGPGGIPGEGGGGRAGLGARLGGGLGAGAPHLTPASGPGTLCRGAAGRCRGHEPRSEEEPREGRGAGRGAASRGLARRRGGGGEETRGAGRRCGAPGIRSPSDGPCTPSAAAARPAADLGPQLPRVRAPETTDGGSRAGAQGLPPAQPRAACPRLPPSELGGPSAARGALPAREQREPRGPPQGCAARGAAGHRGRRAPRRDPRAERARRACSPAPGRA